MPVLVIRVDQRENTAQDGRREVSRLIAGVPEDDEVEESEEDEVDEIHMGEAIVY